MRNCLHRELIREQEGLGPVIRLIASTSPGGLVGWLVGWLVVSLVGWLLVWFVGWLVGGLVGW